ncbi:hypothetical protein ACVW0K_007261 [Streptomyces filamentosus]
MLPLRADGPETQCTYSVWYPAGPRGHLGRPTFLFAFGDLGLLRAHELPPPDENRWTLCPLR